MNCSVISTIWSHIINAHTKATTTHLKFHSKCDVMFFHSCCSTNCFFLSIWLDIRYYTIILKFVYECVLKEEKKEIHTLIAVDYFVSHALIWEIYGIFHLLTMYHFFFFVYDIYLRVCFVAFCWQENQKDIIIISSKDFVYGLRFRSNVIVDSASSHLFKIIYWYRIIRQ